MSSKKAPVIVWFRRDLRLADHEALTAAADSGAPVLPLFILDDETAGDFRPGGASRWWLHHSLEALGTVMYGHGGPLALRQGRTCDVLAELLDETEATAIHATTSYEPHGTRAEEEVAGRCKDRNVDFRRHPGRLLFDPDDIATNDGSPYKVFTPFWKACLARPEPRAPLPVPKFDVYTDAGSVALHDLKLLPTKPDWAGGLRENWEPGETQARETLAQFIDDRLEDYADARNMLPGTPTSLLSPHLHFGEISPRQVWHAVSHASEGGGGKLRAGARTFLKEVGWREFSYHLLHRFPEMPEKPLRSEFADFPWRNDEKALKAWQRGETGYPVVDAAMRQLWHTGWMHNRARMIVASFLVKHLLLPWQEGEAWFWDTLVDADLANNSASWQWVTGCGTDAAPYFRIFNPILQGEKFDPDGEYVRTWVPELERLPASAIHAPWDAAKDVLTEAGVELGKTYPKPIVDHAAARARALEAFDSIKRG